jgi:competence protein ComFA
MWKMRFIVMEDKLVALKGGSEHSQRISQISTIPQPLLNSAFPYNKDLQQLLTGKQLLFDDLPFTLDEIQTHYENGYITFRKGMDYAEKKPICSRCGNKDPKWFTSFPCARCGDQCMYCRKCIIMGRISECTPLIGWNGPPPQFDLPDKILEWIGKLSDGQTTASVRVVDAIRQNEELLVWAVCGAGKTEILFQGIEAALSAQKRVCIATPRTDVVLELTPRLQKAFPKIQVASLYGGSDDRHLYAHSQSQPPTNCCVFIMHSIRLF